MDILYSDRDLAVIIKPAGVDSEHGVPAAITEKLGGEVFPIHRLDLNVGGVMVYARTKQAAAQLSKLVQEGQLVKEYRCLVHGVPPEGGVLEDFLFKDSRKNKVFVVKKERKGVKKSQPGIHPADGYLPLPAPHPAPHRAQPPDPGAVRLPGLPPGGRPQIWLPG